MATLLPWLANGTLPEEERLRVEHHLASCATCRRELDEHRALVELAVRADPHDHLDHVAPALLVTYVSSPGELDTDTRDWVRSALAACPVCRDAAAILERVDRGLARASVVRHARVLPLLRPALAAAAVLAVVAAGLVLLWPDRRAEIASVVSPVIVEPGTRVRDAGVPGAQTAPLELPGGDAVVVLELRTGIPASLVTDPATSFTVELSSGNRVVWRRRVPAPALRIEQGRAVLAMTLDTGALAEGADAVLAIRATRPGDPLDGQALFERRIRRRP